MEARRWLKERVVLNTLLVLVWGSIFLLWVQHKEASSTTSSERPAAGAVAPPDEAQTRRERELFEALRTLPGITTISRDATTVWVGVTLSALGRHPAQRAQELADLIANEYEAHFGRGICVQVYYGDDQPSPRSCVD